MGAPATAAVRLLSGEREPVRVATTGNIILQGLQTVDGVGLRVNDRVLVKDQTDGRSNGIYTASTGRWYRASDANFPRAIGEGVTVQSQEGSTNAGKAWRFAKTISRIGEEAIQISFYLSASFAADAETQVQLQKSSLGTFVAEQTAGLTSFVTTQTSSFTSFLSASINSAKGQVSAVAEQVISPLVRAAQAAKDIAAGYAQDAAGVSGLFVPLFASRQTAAGANILPFINTIQTLCHTIPAGGGGARYTRRVGQGSLAFGFRSNDRYLPNGTTDATNGGYWEIIEEQLDARMAGVIFDYDPVTKIGTDNYQAITRLWQSSLPSISSAAQSADTPPVLWPRGRAYSSETINIKKWVNWKGCFKIRMTGIGTELYFPKGKYGIVLHAAVTKNSPPVLDSPATGGAFGAMIEGICCMSQDLTLTGFMPDYNPAIGRMLTYSWRSLPDVGQALDFCNPRDTATVTGQAVVTGIGEVGTYTFRVAPLSGTFQVGETITQPGGATGKVIYINAEQTGLVVNTTTGTPVVGQTWTGGTSAATARHISRTVLGTSLKAIPIGSVTGTINPVGGDGDIGSIWREAGVYACGIVATTTVYLRDVGAKQFAGDALQIIAPVAGTGSNGNTFEVDGMAARSNGGNGLYFSGSDANAFTSSRLDSNVNTGWAVVDRTFLGGSHSDYHSSNDLAGSYNSTQTVSRQSSWNDCYSESQSIIQPFRSLTTLIDWPNVVKGGTHGLPVRTSPNGMAAARHSGNHLISRGFSYVNELGTYGQVTLSQGTGLLSAGLVLENSGQPGSNRGPAIHLRGPLLGVSALYGQIDANYGATPYLGFKAASSILGPTVTAKGTTGEGFSGFLTVVGGAVTGLVVSSIGRNYSTDTELVVSGGGGTGAVLTPNNVSGSIQGATVASGGSGYTNQSLNETMRVGPSSVSLFPAASVTPRDNGEVTFQLTSNTQLTFKVKGSDGVVRSGSIALA